jgi:hypothetical protein
MARNILLSCGSPARSYGHNSEWWKGQPILKAEDLVKMRTGQNTWEQEPHPEFGEELHRLMAFLDQTERSYAVIDGLVETSPIRSAWGLDFEAQLFHALKDEAADNPSFDISPLMLKGRVVPVLPPQEPSSIGDDVEEEVMDFSFLDVHIDSDSYSWVNTLYDALDHLLWNGALSSDQPYPENAKMAVLVKPSEIITIRLNGAGLSRPCKIPATFYADRYLESRRDMAVHFQTQIHEIRRKGLQQLYKWEQDRIKCNGEQGCNDFQWLDVPHDVRNCYGKIIQTTQYLLERLRKDAQWRYFERRWENGEPYSMDDLRLIHQWMGPLEMTPDERARQQQLERIIEVSKNKIDEVNQDMDRRFIIGTCQQLQFL